MVSTEKVEKVVNEPINPVPINKVNSALIGFFKVKIVRNQLSKNNLRDLLKGFPEEIH